MRKLLRLKIEELSMLDNSRLTYKGEGMAELMTSMKFNGQLQPIGVNWDADSSTYGVVFGNRRVEAAKKLGWTYIEALEVENAEDEKSVLTAHLAENTAREDISESELGRYFYALNKEHGMTVQEISARVGASERKVSDCIAFFTEVPKEHRDQIKVYSGHRNTKGRQPGIPRSSAKKLLTTIRSAKLNKRQESELFELAKKPTIRSHDIGVLANLLRRGYSPSEAEKYAAGITVIHMSIPISRREVARIQKATGLRVTEVFSRLIAKKYKILDDKSYEERNSATKKRGGRPLKTEYVEAY